MAQLWHTLRTFFAEYEVLWRIVVILVGCLAVNWVLRVALHRAVHSVVRGVKRARQVTSTQQLTVLPQRSRSAANSAALPLSARAVQRTRTLGALSRNLINWLTAITALILILAQLNINLTAVVASAGVIAAGLAFGAQNIVKDLLNGIFMAFEDQLGVGDLVTIGQVTGIVEDVGIRVTKVRASDGTLWFIRNGEILMLGNASQTEPSGDAS